MRRDYEKFVERNVALLVTGPENAGKFAKYFTDNQLPFTGLPDPEHRVLRLYGQEIKLFKFGRMPAQVLIDRLGIARLVYYGNSMRDIPSTEDILTMVDRLSDEDG